VLRLDEVKVLLVFLAFGLLVYSLIDCSRTPESAMPSTLPRAAWVVVMILLPIVGPLYWLVATRTNKNRGPGSAPSSGPARRPIGPDDDPDFLHGL
jgi:hypothetical protein